MKIAASPFARTLVGFAWMTVLLPKLYCAEKEFRIFAEPIEIPERGVVTGYVLLTEGRRFSFVPPARWGIKPDGLKSTVSLLPEDLSASISFKIVPDDDGEKLDLKSERPRQKVLERYPDAKIKNQFKCYTSGEEGVAFDIERLVEEKIAVSSRIAFVVFDGGIVEFELTANTKKFTDYKFVFGTVLSSFRIDPAPAKSSPRSGG